MMDFLAFIRSLDPSLVVLIVMSALVICVVWSWHANKSNDFHLQQVLVDSVTGKIAIEKVGFMTVLALMSWGFVALILRDKMSEWYVGLFGGLFVLGRITSSGLSVLKELKSPLPPQ